MPRSTVFVINAVPPGMGFAQNGVIDGPPILAVARDHLLMRFNVNPSNVVIRSAIRAAH